MRTDRALGTADQRSTVLRYDSQGRVSAELSALGASQLKDGLTAAQVDAIWAAHSTQHAYDAAGRRIRSTDAKGQVTLLYYDADGRVAYRIAKTALGGEVEGYRYNGFGEVTATQRYSKRLSTTDTTALQGGQASATLDQKVAALIDLSDQARSSFYNTVGRLEQVMDAVGNKTDYVYDAFGQLSRSTTSIDADGGKLRRLVTQTVRDRRGLVTSTTQDPGGLAVTTRSEYDAFGRVTASIDGLGRRSTYKYTEGDGKSDGGRQVIITDATSAQRSTTYDAFDRIVRQTDALGNSVAFQYNTSARRLTLTTASGVVTVTDSNAHGQVVKLSDAQGTTTYEYDANGNRTRSTDALGNQVQDEFDAINRLTAHTVDPSGLKLKTTYEYDAANRVLAQRVDPDGLNLTTTFEYDAQGRAVRVTDAAGVITRYDFDGEGRLKTQVVDEAGLKLTTNTSYDAQGRVLTVRRFAGTTGSNASAAQVTEYHHDLLGRRIQEVVDPAGLKLTTNYDYDAAGQVVRVSDTLGVRKRYVYDAAGRETYCIDALGGVERREYDAEGRLVRKTHYANSIVTDGLPVAATSSQIQALLSPNAATDLVERRGYDTDDRLRFVIDALGGVSETRYDSLGRVSQSTGYATMLSGADLASAMDLATTNSQISTLVGKFSDAGRDRTTRLAYDGAGRLRFTADAVGAVTETVYDPASRVIRTTQYAKALAANATVQAPATDARDRTTRTVYDAAGRAVQQVDAEGYLTTNQYDNAGNLTQTLRYASRVQRPEALAAGTRVAVLAATATPPAQGAYLLEDATLINITNFQYDRLNRRTLSLDVEQNYETTAYNDALGASVERRNTLGGVATLVYDVVGRLVQETLPVTSKAADGTQQPVVNRYEYDVRGNRTKAMQAFGLPEQRTTLYRYDAMNRQVRTIGMAYNLVDAAGKTSLVTPVDLVRYNAQGQAVEETTHATLADPAQLDGTTSGGRTRRSFYDTAGRKAAELSPDFVLTRLSYDGLGNLLTRSTDGGPDGERTLRFAYDLMGRKTQTQIDGAWTWEMGQPLTLNGVAGNGGVGATTPQTLVLETLRYDAFGDLQRRTDARGNASFTYHDRLGRTQLQIDAAGYATAWDYDRPGAAATRETRYARAVPIAYDMQSNGTTVQAVRAALAQAGPDPDAADRVTQYTLDRLGRVTERAVLNVSFEFSPTSLDRGLTHTGTANAVTSYTYDGMGHVTRISERIGVRPPGQADALQVTDIQYDALGRELRREAPQFLPRFQTDLIRPTTDIEYDGLGQVVRNIRRGRDNTTETDDRITRYIYDANGRPLLVIDAENNVVRQDYDANGDTMRTTYLSVQRSDGSRRNLAKTFRYDAAGRLVETVDLDTGETRQTRFNAFGEAIAQGNNGGEQEWFEYDVQGQVIKTNSGDGTVKFYLRDANGNVTRELRAGLGSSTTRDLRNTTLAEVLADPNFLSTVHVYDARNQEVRTIQPRMAQLDNETTLAGQFTDTWVSQRGDLNGALSGTIATPGHSTATSANGGRTPLTGGVPGTAPGGSGNSTGTGTAISVALPSGSVAVLAGLNPSNTTVTLPGTTTALTQAAIALQIPSSWPVGHYRVSQTLTTPGTTDTPIRLTESATAGGSVMVGGGSPNFCQIDIEWQPSASNVWQPIAQMSLAKLVNQQLTSATFTWTPLTNANTKLYVDLTPESGWGNATRFQLLVDPDNPVRAQTTGPSRLPGDRLGMFDLAKLVAMAGSDHQLVLQAFDSTGRLVGGRKFKVTGTDASTLAEASGDAALYAGGDGTVRAQNSRSAAGQVQFAMLQWDLGPAHAGDGTLRWRKAGATADPWNSTAISAPSGSSALVIGGPGNAIPDGSYYFVLEQGDARVTGSFTLTGGALTLADSRLKPMALTPERVTINGPVDAQGRGRVALTIGSVTVTATTDANGQASFDLSQIRQSLGLDRWSVSSQAFSYAAYIDQGNGQRQLTHSEHGTLLLRAPRIDGNDTFQFTADSSTEYEAEAVITVPSTAGTLKLTPVGGTAVSLTLGSDWRLVRNGNDLTVNLDGQRPAWGAADQLVDWAFTGSDGKTASGRLRITNKGVVTREGAASGTPTPELRLTPPSGTTAVALTLSLGNNQTAQLSPSATVNGTRVYDLKAYLPTSGSKTLTYTLQTSGANGVGLTRGSGTLTLAADGTVTSTAFDERRAINVALRIDGRNVPQAKLDVSGVGNVTLTGTWVPPAQVTHPDGSKSDVPGDAGYTRFDWDASAVTQPTQQNGPALLSYTLTAQDSSGATLNDDLGRPLVQNGRIVLDANHAKRPVQLQQQVKSLNLDSDFAVSSTLSYNAFGEVSEERDERVAERTRALLGRALTADELAAAGSSYRYNALGKLITRTEAQTGITADNGFAYRARPVTTYSYDLLGRMTVQMDANGARSVRTLLEGSTDAVVRLVNVERTRVGTTGTPMPGDQGSLREITYNIFGEAEVIRNEVSRNTNQTFDKLGRLVQVRHTVDRLSGQAQTYDAYAYDALGQQIQHVQYAGLTARPTVDASGMPLARDAITADDQVTRTDYDGLGRVVATVSAAGFLTGYAYSVVSVTGLNGSTTTGTHRITRLPTNRTLVDDTDYFGHLTAHHDQSGMVTTYRYDAAARLLQQTSTVHAGQAAGQDIRYTYYANGALKTQADATAQTCTDFSYDDAGNRSAEAYFSWVGGRRVGTFQSNTLAYDELGRVLRVSDGNDYSVRYEYDAVGNRRLVDASYWDAAAGARKAQTYWYKYNNLNQVQVTKGVLAGVDGKPHERGTGLLDTQAQIVPGEQGMALQYNALGERTQAAYFAKNPDKSGQPFEQLVETYTNDSQGHVLEVKRNGKTVLSRTLDLAGRTVQEEEFKGSNRSLSNLTYDKDNRLLTQGNTTFLYDNGSGAAPSATGAGPLAKTVTGQGSSQTTTTTTYEYWDDARQKTVQKTNAAGTGTIELSYNANGHLVREDDKAANLTTTFLNSANGLVLQRERQQNQVAVGSHLFFYADGRRVGEIRNDPSDNAHPTLAEEQTSGTPADNSQLFKTFKPVVSADFDQNFSPVNHGEPGPASGSYTVRDGDTLAGVAQQIWGDTSLWYLIAEANGMAGTETLRGGQVLRIPNGVTTIHNNSQTLRPYNPAEVIGNLDPTILRPPPPVTHCGVLSAIVGAVVAVVVTVYSGGNAAAGAAAGDVARQYSSAALNDRLDWGNFFREGLKLAVLGQVSPLAAGIYTWKHREHPPGFTGENTFDYKSTVIAGLAGLASQGAGVLAQGAPGYLRAGLQAGAAAATRQGLNYVTNRSEDFSWRAVLASAIGAAAGTQVTGYLEGDWGDVLGEGGARAGGGLAGGLLEQRLLKREQRDYRGVFASTLGSVVGDSIVGGMSRSGYSGEEMAGDFQRENNRFAAAAQANAAEAQHTQGFVPELNYDGTRPVYDFGDPFEVGGVDGNLLAANGSATRLITARPLAQPPSLGELEPATLGLEAAQQELELIDEVLRESRGRGVTRGGLYANLAYSGGFEDFDGAGQRNILAAMDNYANALHAPLDEDMPAGRVLPFLRGREGEAQRADAAVRIAADRAYESGAIPQEARFAAQYRQGMDVGMDLMANGILGRRARERLYQTKELTLPNGHKTTVAVQDNALVQVDKVEIYARGGSPDVTSELKAMQQFKQSARKEFDLDPANEARLESLKKLNHNFERSQETDRLLEGIGLSNNPKNNSYIIRRLLNTGNGVTPENTQGLRTELTGPNGSLDVYSNWKVLPDKSAYLTTFIMMPRKAKP